MICTEASTSVQQLFVNFAVNSAMAIGGAYRQYRLHYGRVLNILLPIVAGTGPITGFFLFALHFAMAISGAYRQYRLQYGYALDVLCPVIGDIGSITRIFLFLHILGNGYNIRDGRLLARNSCWRYHCYATFLDLR